MKKMLKKVMALALAVMMITAMSLMNIDDVFSISASALTSKDNAMENSNAKWSYDTSNKTLTISGSGAIPNYSDTPSAFTKYNAKLVVTIINNAKTIVVENGITSIGNNVFKGFKNVTSVSIPDSVTNIGDYAFMDCISLTSITINNPECEICDDEYTIDSNATIYGYEGSTAQAYAEKYGREFVAIEETEIIASGECGENLTWTLDSEGTLTIAGTGDMDDYDTPEELFSPWFEYNESIQKIVIENGVTSVGDCAFEDCDNITSITIPENVTSIGYSAFYDCDSLTNITIGNSVKTIGGYSFWSCDSLVNIIFGDSVETIGTYAFFMCKNLATITLPDSVTSICDDAFVYCNSLISVTIGNGVETIGFRAFGDCSSLTSITILNSACEIYDREYTIDKNATIYGYEGSTAQAYAEAYGREFVALEEDNSEEILNALSYKIIDGEVEITDCDTSFAGDMVIPDTIDGYPVTSIGTFAFYNCTSLTSITIPDSVTSIGDEAFYDCLSLTSITIPDSVTSIGDAAFGDCSSLESITIPDSVISIGSYAFENCTSLESITIPDSVTSIGDKAFLNCESLTSITIPDSVTSIGDKAFLNCESLTSITIPDSVTSIGSYAFCGCTSLTSITIPDSVTSIGDDTFYYCSSLESVTIGDSVTSIGEWAFGYCASLTSITIPDSVTSIGDYAFEACYNLTSITIPDSVTSIGGAAFHDCTSLTSITIPDSVTSIGDFAFYYCSSLESITIPDSVTSIGDYAFYNCSSLESITILNPDCEIYDSKYTIDENATIYGYEGSTAEAYAEKYGREFVALDKECEHNYVEEITTPATCTEKGEKTFTCSVCGDVKTEEIEALGHDWNEITDSYKVCNRCGEIVYDTSVSLGKVTGRPGETVEVYVVFDSDTDVKTMSVSGIDYDASKLTLVKGEWLADGSVIDDWDQNKKAGVITFKENTTLSGNVFVLTFKIKDELEDCEVVIDCDFGIKAMNENNVETALAVEVVPGSVTITNIIKGDVNGDDYVDSNDAIHLLYNTMLPDLYEVNQNCDFNGDGYVDSNDAIYLLYYTMLPDIYPLS